MGRRECDAAHPTPMISVELESDAGFAQLFAPLESECLQCYWLLDLVAGPFTAEYSTDEQWRQLEEEVEPLNMALPGKLAETTCWSLWRPGILPRFADLLWEDEWGYLLPFHAENDQAALEAVATFEDPRNVSPAELWPAARAYLVELSWGHWHAYLRDARWADLLRAGPMEIRELGADCRTGFRGG